MSLPEYLLLQHFYAGLDKESAHHLDLTSGGSFAHLTPTESRKVLDKILDRTSFVRIHEPVPTEPEMRQAEPLEIESEPLKVHQQIQFMKPPLNINPKHRRRKTLHLRSFSEVSSWKSLKTSATPQDTSARSDHQVLSLLRIP